VKANGLPVFQKSKKLESGNDRLISLTSVPGKVMDHLILETISKCMKNKKVVGRTQHGFVQEESCLTSLIAF